MPLKRKILNFDGIKQFTATISKYGHLDNSDQGSTCLTNIEDVDGHLIVDHLWFPFSIKPLRPVAKNIGTVISFFATSKLYFYGDLDSDRGSYSLNLIGNVYVAIPFADRRCSRQASHLRYLLRKNRNRYVIAKIKNGIPTFFSNTSAGNPRWGKDFAKFYESEYKANGRLRYFLHPEQKRIFKILVYNNRLYLGLKSNRTVFK